MTQHPVALRLAVLLQSLQSRAGPAQNVTKVAPTIHTVQEWCQKDIDEGLIG